MRRLTSLVAIGVIATSAAACGSSSSGGNVAASNPPATTVSPTAAVKTLMTTFFSEPSSQVSAYLQDGAQLGKAIKVAQRLLGTAQERAVVKNVVFGTPATTATVTYALQSKASGSSKWTTLLHSSTSTVVEVNGHWLFSKESFCDLVELANPKVAGCS